MKNNTQLFKFPDIFVRSMIGLGSLALLYLGSWFFCKTIFSFWNKIKTIGNSSRNLKHQNDPKKQDYVVVYGATNKGGITFASFLARKGYNIILIDTEKDKIEKSIESIKAVLHENEFKAIDIIKMSTDQFDE